MSDRSEPIDRSTTDEPEEVPLDDAELDAVAGGAASAVMYEGVVGEARKTSLAFPDVCKMPGPPAPMVPVPYPNVGVEPGTAEKTTAKKKIT